MNERRRTRERLVPTETATSPPVTNDPPKRKSVLSRRARRNADTQPDTAPTLAANDRVPAETRTRRRGQTRDAATKTASQANNTKTSTAQRDKPAKTPSAANGRSESDRTKPAAKASSAPAASRQRSAARSGQETKNRDSIQRPKTQDHDDEQDHDAAVSAAIAKSGTRRSAKQGSGGKAQGRSSARPGGISEEMRRSLVDGPPRVMLVTARHDRTQIAVMEDRSLVEHYVTRHEDVTYVGNIYMARVQNVLPGMEAAFLDIGKGRNGVLYAGEVLYDELDLEEGADERIENVMKPGQTMLVQVTKDPMGTKGPRLTMRLSLAGRYLVLAPNSDLFGISRKLTDKERDRLRRIVKSVRPDGHGVIVRTAAEGATEEQLAADIARLIAKWDRVAAQAANAKALTAVYEEPPLVVKVIRDIFGPEYERLIVDDATLFTQIKEYLEEVAPDLMDKIELYGAVSQATEAAEADDSAETKTAETVKAAPDTSSRVSLFDAYSITDQLRKAMSRKVWLPSGGYLIIETTEAMKVIDVNTGKFTGDRANNLEEVVLKTNLEAADEIVRQLRLRDIGGIIVIDFIDMLLKANQDQVVRRLKRELLRDRTKTRVSEVSRLGLVQMTRKNVSQGLIESFSHTCEACEGRGVISEIE
ncbi:MAG: Rne/Rng family ribonuclease [Nitriliruptoraceae bacterium]